MDPDKTIILYGPPGTGKTTHLIKVVEQYIQGAGVPPNEIVFVAFTRKAAYEAKSRTMEKFNFVEEQIPWFRTLHSLAFECVGASKQGVMGIRDYFALANMLGLTITAKSTFEDGNLACMTKGDRLFFAENMARATRMTLRDYWETIPDEDIYFYELERLQKTLEDYKRVNNKMDFTDMIQKFIDAGQGIPGSQVLIVDEAQDLTPLQWDAIRILAKDVRVIIIAGDDDQAIFRWAGADIDTFINLKGNRNVLKQSYRVPAEVQQMANNVASRINVRVPKEWSPRDAIGAIEYVTSVEQLDMSKESWLLLGRNVYILDRYVHHCMREGLIFECAHGQNVLKSDTPRAINVWNHLLNGHEMKMGSARIIFDFMSSKVGVMHGFKKQIAAAKDHEIVDIAILRDKYGLVTSKPWDQALDKLKPEEVEYFKAAFDAGETISDKPRIKISTIHGAKGGEAENVVVATDMAMRTWNEFQKFPDDEHRVWYVAITRAKKKLFILQPTTNMCYTL